MFKAIRSALLWTVGLLFMIVFLYWLLFQTYYSTPEKYSPKLRKWLKVFFKLLFIKVEVEGLENVDFTKTYIIMSNHVSMFDIPLLLAFIPQHFNGFEADGHFKAPLYGRVLTRYGNIPMDRSNPRASFKSLQAGIDYTEKGTSVVILPEGTRTVTPEFGEFKKLPFVFAQKTNADIMVLGFSGLWKINNKTSWHITPGKMTVRFGKPIPSEYIKSVKPEELMEYTKNKIQELVTEP